MIKNNPTTAEYAVQRLADLGIRHVFGLPGDYAFPIDDAIESNPNLTWIVCSNELNAAYSADGYARVFGASILSTTYGVGELGAMAGVMGAKAERLPIFHLVGMPSTRLMRTRKPLHHTFGDGEFNHFHQLSSATACVSTILTPENAITEMERVIAIALSQRQPAIIAIAGDYAQMPVIGNPIQGVPLHQVSPPKSNPQELECAVKTILQRLEQAQQPVILPCFTLLRYGLTEQFTHLLKVTGIPYATTRIDKAVISESHPLYMGMYRGATSESALREYVESADLILDIGGVLFDDVSTGHGSARLDREKIISIHPHHVEILSNICHINSQSHTYSPVWIGDVISNLIENIKPISSKKFPQPSPITLEKNASQAITWQTLRATMQNFLEAEDILICESGLSVAFLSSLLLPKNCSFHNQTLWAAIGWATPATFGAALANPQRRVILVTGDGAHQLTANEIGTMGRYGVKPIIIVLNNGIFGIEEFLAGNKSNIYNVLSPWNYAQIPHAMGCENWYCQKVTSLDELNNALEKARLHNNGAYIEVVLTEKIPPALSEKIYAQRYQLLPIDTYLSSG
ncbi:MAG: alpha-keto acid decarboxylase family protein [Geminocystis sp.]